MLKRDDKINSSLTVVSQNTKIKGDIDSGGDVRIKGAVEGFVKTTQKVYVEKGARIQGNVSAKEVVIKGRTNGDIKTDHLELSSDSNVLGNIETKILVMEEGAVFNGNFKMSSPP